MNFQTKAELNNFYLKRRTWEFRNLFHVIIEKHCSSINYLLLYSLSKKMNWMNEFTDFWIFTCNTDKMKITWKWVFIEFISYSDFFGLTLKIVSLLFLLVKYLTISFIGYLLANTTTEKEILDSILQLNNRYLFYTHTLHKRIITPTLTKNHGPAVTCN